MSERIGVKRAVAGASLVGYTVFGFLYTDSHHPPVGLFQEYIDGKRVADCPSEHIGRKTTFMCELGPNSTFTEIVPTASLTNHGPYAAIDNLLDSHELVFGISSGVAWLPGLMLLISAAKGGAKKEETATSIPEVTVPDLTWIVREPVNTPGFQDITMLPYAPEYPVAPDA